MITARASASRPLVRNTPSPPKPTVVAWAWLWPKLARVKAMNLPFPSEAIFQFALYLSIP